ncbi:hypothetical protein BDN72DRAFT_741194, partial [Pluteus cervinus]
LVVRFPPGSTIVIPSSTIEHGNTPIAANEERASITQFCAGGLIRWVNHGFQKVGSLMKDERGQRVIRRVDGPPGQRWKSIVESFSLFSNLAADR